MPLHFTLSEIVICAVAVWSARRLWLNGQVLGSIGFVCFGFAALIGIIRIASGADEILAPAHRFAAQAGGAFGLVLFVSEAARHRGWSVTVPAVVISAGVAAMAVVTGGAWGQLVFLVVLLTGALLIATDSGRQLRALRTLGFAIMAPNVLFVRQSPFLGTDASWHAYHLITALWLVAVIAGLQSAQIETPKRGSPA